MQREELLRSHHDLEAALARYAALYDFAPVGYFTLSSDGTIREVNRAGAALLGGTRAHLVDRRFGVFVAESSRPTLAKALDEVFAGHATIGCDLALRLEGAPHAIAVHLTLAREAGDTDCRVIAVDLTERKRAEERLQASQKMEAIGRLAGGVAHDFNNMLTVILSHASFALEDVEKASPLEQDLVNLKVAAERAAALTQQLLAFSRQQVLKPAVVDVNELAARLVVLLRRLLPEHIDLSFLADPELGRVNIDPVQLEQVLMNLALNARDAMPGGGELRLTTSNVNARHVRIRVQDTGGGMDEATVARIFEPFFTTKGGRGTGLGLATVYGIVRQCGGEIEVHTILGSGTTFDVTLPRTHTTPPPVVVPTPDRDHEPAHQVVLVVEDEAALRGIFQRMLGSAGYQVLVADSGFSALDLVAAHAGPVDLVVTDVMMPKMSGVALAERLRSSHPETRILYMSGYSNEVLGPEGVLAPDTHFIGKPFTARELKDKVREILASTRRPTLD
ncbi:MAG: response regulator [Myxococcales bacterium]|nr:response regulator [Myxococcales bacterium]